MKETMKTWKKAMGWARYGAGDRRRMKRFSRWATERWFSPASPTTLFPVIRKRRRNMD